MTHALVTDSLPVSAWKCMMFIVAGGEAQLEGSSGFP